MSTSSEVPAHRACAACRGQKVRCIINTEDNPDVCQRCARTGRPCVFTPLQKRKQRKRTDTRVAELEREMRAMRGALREKELANGLDDAQHEQQKRKEARAMPKGLWYRDMQPDAPRLAQTASWETSDTSLDSIQRTGPSLWPSKYINQPLAEGEDVIDRGIVSLAVAEQLFETYRSDLFPNYPMVAIASSVTCKYMRQNKPALLLAIIAAAASKENSDLSAALDKEVLQTYATRSLLQSEKSLELVQALLISAAWYNPPTKYGQLKYYEYIHMAATMAMDIGIGSRPQVHRNRFQYRKVNHATTPSAKDLSNVDLCIRSGTHDNRPDTADIESRRTFLACYIICAGVSLSLRRQNMLRVSSYIRDCVSFIEQAPDALPTDATLIAWVRLMIIGEEISTSFCYDDPGGIATLAELRTQLMLRDFERRLSEWHVNVPEADMGTGSMVIMYQTIRLYLFEIALHVDHSPEDFRAPYQMGGITPTLSSDPIPTQILAESIAECITSVHRMLTAFFDMQVESLRALPVFSYVRISFAVFVLAKLCLSAAHPRSRIGQVLDRSALKVEIYMDRAILHVRNIIGPKKSRIPSIFLALLFKLRMWCLEPETVDQEGGAELLQDRKFPEEESETAASRLGGMNRERNSIYGNTLGKTAGGSADEQGNVVAVPRSDDPSGIFNASASSGQVGPRSGSTGGTQGLNCSSLSSANLWENADQLNADANLSWPPPDQMQLDMNLLQMLGEMNAFSEGGLTGLDDWGNFEGVGMGMEWTDLGMPPSG